MRLSPDLLDVSRQKLVGYLLATDHPDGRGKAVFFERAGFSRDQPDALARALLRHATDHDALAEPSPFGERFVVDGLLDAPAGRRVHIRAVWFRETGASRVRLVTAYPIRP